MLCAPSNQTMANFEYFRVSPFPTLNQTGINSEKCIKLLVASRGSQIDKPQRGRPKRAELPDVNINTGAQSINTERAFKQNNRGWRHLHVLMSPSDKTLLSYISSLRLKFGSSWPRPPSDTVSTVFNW